MHLRVSAFAAGFAAISAAPVVAQDFQKTFMGGPTTGEYSQMAADVGALAGRCGISLDVVESEGGLDNLLAVRRRPFTQLGLSREDVLEYLSTFADSDPVIADVVQGMRIVMPLHDEEVHIAARSEIESLQDLNGKRVFIGPPGASSFMTATLVLDLAGVEPAERVSFGYERMMPALLEGEVDAVIFAAGAPLELPLQNDMDPDEWHLIPVVDETVTTVYEPAMIPAGSYPFQREPIQTVSAKAVLLTYEFDPNRSAYHRESCKAVSDVSHLMATRLDELKEVGHPKWRTVDAAGADEMEWDVSTCAAIGQRPDYELDCGDAGVERTIGDSDEAYRQRICESLGIEC